MNKDNEKTFIQYRTEMRLRDPRIDEFLEDYLMDSESVEERLLLFRRNLRRQMENIGIDQTLEDYRNRGGNSTYLLELSHGTISVANLTMSEARQISRTLKTPLASLFEP